MNNQQPSETPAQPPDLVEALREAHRDIQELQAQIAEFRWIESALRRRTHELSERIKELECLYAISNCIRNPQKGLHEILAEVANAIPSGYQYPRLTSACVTVADRAFCSSGFREGTTSDTCSLVVGGKQIGSIQVSVTPPATSTEYPVILPEEKTLLRAVALWVEEIVEHKSCNEN